MASLKIFEKDIKFSDLSSELKRIYEIFDLSEVAKNQRLKVTRVVNRELGLPDFMEKISVIAKKTEELSHNLEISCKKCNKIFPIARTNVTFSNVKIMVNGIETNITHINRCSACSHDTCVIRIKDNGTLTIKRCNA